MAHDSEDWRGSDPDRAHLDWPAWVFDVMINAVAAAARAAWGVAAAAARAAAGPGRDGR